MGELWETIIKYQRYIEKEQEVANRILKFEDIPLPADYDYFTLSALSYECREKLNRYRPTTIGQASRISGISPADKTKKMPVVSCGTTGLFVLFYDTYDNLFRYSFASGPRFINRSRILRLGVKGILSENTW